MSNDTNKDMQTERNTRVSAIKCWTNQGKCPPNKTKIVWDMLDCWSEEVLCETDSQER